MSLKAVLHIVLGFMGLAVADMGTMLFGAESKDKTTIQCWVNANYESAEYVVTCPAPADRGKTRTFFVKQVSQSGLITCAYWRQVGISLSGLFEQNEAVFDCTDALYAEM